MKFQAINREGFGSKHLVESERQWFQIIIIIIILKERMHFFKFLSAFQEKKKKIKTLYRRVG